MTPPDRPGGGTRRRRRHRHRRPRQLPAGAPARQGALQPSRRVHVLHDEAGIPERTGVRPEQYVHYAALRRPVRQPARRAQGGREDRRPLSAPYGDPDGIFAHTAEQTPALRRNLRGERGVGPHQRRDDGVGARRAVEVGLRVDQARHRRRRRCSCLACRKFPSLVPRLAEAWPELFGDGGRGGARRCRGRDHRRRHWRRRCRGSGSLKAPCRSRSPPAGSGHRVGRRRFAPSRTHAGVGVIPPICWPGGGRSRARRRRDPPRIGPEAATLQRWATTKPPIRSCSASDSASPA